MLKDNFTVSGQIVDIFSGTIYPGKVTVADSKIHSIERVAELGVQRFICPGFVDAHVHIESSMLPPPEFARLAVCHGSVATVSDPHEIANVLGSAGVEYMIAEGQRVPFKFYFGAPSCVPATSFETAGAVLGVPEVTALLERPEVVYLAEVMNFPGVLQGDVDLLGKIAAAKKLGKRVDGHAPGLRGTAVEKYIAAGIETDHECFTLAEAEEKASLGMKILIREGSAAKNFNTLIPIIRQYPALTMFCSDDKHPDDLIKGHINQIVSRAVALGYDLFDILKAATLNPVQHYGLNVGLLRVGDPADFIVLEDLKEFKVLQTFIDGQQVAEAGRSLISQLQSPIVNNFMEQEVTAAELQVRSAGSHVRLIEVIDGELITKSSVVENWSKNDILEADSSKDYLKIVVFNRYKKASVARAFVKNIGLQQGALASSVAHDSHNIVAVGCDDHSLAQAINAVTASRGGIALVKNSEVEVLPLPIAGLMSNLPGEEVAHLYEQLDAGAKAAGCNLRAPYMSLSFLALLVIPELKLSDLGLFNGQSFEFVGLFSD